MDRALLNFFEQEITKKISISARRALFNLAKIAKEDLAINNKFQSDLELDGKTYQFSITREKFEEIIAVFVDKTMLMIVVVSLVCTFGGFAIRCPPGYCGDFEGL